MISKETILAFLTKGFQYIQSNVQGVTFLYQAVGEKVSVCALVEESKSRILHPEDYKDIEFQIERKLLLSGYRDVETLFFIFSDYPEKIKSFAAHDFKFWILDRIAKKVIIYENQPEDFFSMKDEMEKILNHPPAKREKLWDKIPFITLTLVLINVVIYVLSVIGNTREIIYQGALYWGYLFYDFEFYRLLTSMFLHSGITHLMNNVIILILAGNQLEATIGKWRYIVIYFVSGVGAGLVSAIFHMLNNQPTLSVGASGAIYGVIGAMAGIMYKNRKKFGSRLGVQFFVLIAFIFYDGFFRTNIDVAAHAGGLIFGIVLSLILYKKRTNIYKVS